MLEKLTRIVITYYHNKNANHNLVIITIVITVTINSTGFTKPGKRAQTLCRELEGSCVAGTLNGAAGLLTNPLNPKLKP